MIQVIPAIDLMGGRCVRLTHGDFDRKTVYDEDPLEVAKRFEAAGIKRLHIVDLDGARSGKPMNRSVLEQIAQNTSLVIDFGGGLKTDRDVESVFDAGAAMANIGSVAITEEKMFLAWVEKYGPHRILLGVDVKNGNVAINGWQTDTQIAVMDVLSRYASHGVTTFFVTDVGKDGAMNGPSLKLYTQILASLPDSNLIASGGVSSIRDVEDLEQIGCAGVIIGKAIYEGRVSLEELSKYAG